MEDLIYKNCFYCNEEPKDHPSENRYKYGKGLYKRNGIDRLDNTRGYTIDNCVPCCTRCNTIKLDASYDEFIAKIKQIYNFHIEKGSTTK